ncbi:MAG: hypothetical protein AB7P03_12290 [Kofleriaceae bacterium]
MRTISVIAGLSVLLVSSTVLAEDIAGAYDVKYEEVSNNCASPLRYPNGKIELKLKGTQVTIDIDRTPLMTGSAAKGKISAKSKQGRTMVEGMDGVFSIAGKVTPEGLLAVVMVGEYSAGGKALCTQSWNVTGTKSKRAR